MIKASLYTLWKYTFNHAVISSIQGFLEFFFFLRSKNSNNIQDVLPGSCAVTNEAPAGAVVILQKQGLSVQPAQLCAPSTESASSPHPLPCAAHWEHTGWR